MKNVLPPPVEVTDHHLFSGSINVSSILTSGRKLYSQVWPRLAYFRGMYIITEFVNETGSSHSPAFQPNPISRSSSKSHPHVCEIFIVRTISSPSETCCTQPWIWKFITSDFPNKWCSDSFEYCLYTKIGTKVEGTTDNRNTTNENSKCTQVFFHFRIRLPPDSRSDSSHLHASICVQTYRKEKSYSQYSPRAWTEVRCRSNYPLTICKIKKS